MRFNLFRKSQEHELEIEQIPEFLREHRSKEIDEESRKIRDMVKTTDQELKKLGSFIEKLDKKEPIGDKLVGQRKPGVHLADHYDNYSINVKNKFCARAMEILDDLGYDGTDYASFLTYLEKSSEAIASIGGISMKEFRHLRAFSEELKPVAAQIKLLSSILENNRKNARNLELHRNLRDIEGFIAAKKALEGEKVALEKEIDDIGAQISDGRKIESEQLNEIEEIRKDANAVEKLTAEKKLLERERSDAKASISTVLSGLDRLLRKFLHSPESKPMEHMVKTYMMNPADAYLGDDESIKKIVNALQAMKKLTADEMKRVNNIADNIMDLEKHKDEFLLKSNEIERVERLIEEHSDVFRRLDASEDALREIRKKIAELEKSSEKKLSRMAAIGKEVQEIAEKTKSRAEAMKIEIKIK